MGSDYAWRRLSQLLATLVVLGAILLTVGAGPPQGHPDHQALQNAPDDTAEFHVGKGLEAMKNSRYRKAIEEFRTALALDPNLTVRARFPLAVALFDIQDIKGARREFELVRSKTGDAPDVAYYMGRLDLMESQLGSAIRNLTLAATDPPFPDTAYYLGYAYIKERDTAKAEEWLHKAAKAAPQDFRVQERLGLLYRSMGRKEEAEKAFALSDKLEKRNVEASGTAIECGRALDTRPVNEARDICHKLFDPEDTGRLVALGTLYGDHGDYTDALGPFRRAAEIEPDSYEMQYNLGLTYFRLRRYAEARAPLEKAVELRPDMFETTAPLGAVLYVLGDDRAAYEVLARANELRPENGDVSGLLFKVALVLAHRSSDRKDYVAALRYLLKAAEARPDEPEVRLRLAEVYDLLGDKSRAAKEREEAQRLGQLDHR